MLNIEYEIKLNEQGRPYVELPEDYENKPEHKFFAIEITRYLLEFAKQRRLNQVSEDTINKLTETNNILGQISDEIAEILYNEMKDLGESSFLISKNYHIIVDNYDELLSINNIVVYDGKIFDVINGLKALVVNEEKIYEYIDGKWNEIV